MIFKQNFYKTQNLAKTYILVLKTLKFGRTPFENMFALETPSHLTKKLTNQNAPCKKNLRKVTTFGWLTTKREVKIYWENLGLRSLTVRTEFVRRKKTKSRYSSSTVPR